MRLVPLVPAALLLLGCAPYTLRHDYDTGANFRAYRTFEWYAASRRAKGSRDGDSPILDRRVQAAVIQQLKAQGFAEAGGGEPDFLVAWYPIYRDRRYRTTTRMGVDASPGGGRSRRFGYGVGTRFSEVHHFREGTLVVEIVDGRSNQLVWQGAAVGALSSLGNPEEAQAQVARAVADVLTRFPPR